ncbi:unnamed protein product [Onchocerca flexuosa]|uniref:Ovule protein n=1 Tax=Onchocerca flexuosa TaxID=387005 RepID=A0A183H9R1_9BILA|nr:unnamed protein product [Onchocerca flexuosa]
MLSPTGRQILPEFRYGTKNQETAHGNFASIFRFFRVLSRENLPTSQLFPWRTISQKQTRHFEHQKPRHHIVLRSANHFKNCYFSPIQCVLVEEQ